MDGFSYGIDVMVANMGPMRTRFWEGKKILDVAKPFLLVESTPEDAADVMLANVGRFWIRDHSALNAGLRLLVRVIDTNLLVGIQAAIKGYLPDARKNPELF
jgi:short-subunit dehydrogenase